jgi:cell division protein FtsN
MKKLIVLALIVAMITMVSFSFAKKVVEEPNTPDANAPKDSNTPKAEISVIMLADEPNAAEPNAVEPNMPKN